MSKEQETVVAAPPNGSMQHIDVDQIHLGKMNPRKEINQDELQELANSINQHGVIQPVLLRPNKQGFELVAGQRRWRASKLAGKKTIPAYVRELTDEQAAEAAIIENLQRQDVKPWEEATAFKYLVEKQKLSVKEICNKVGKTPKYISRIMSLAYLFQGFMDKLKAGELRLNEATEVAVFPEDVQRKMFKAGGGHVYPGLLRQFQGDFRYARFDTTDPNLDKKMGACTICPFNSANNVLFAEAMENPTCQKPDCFNKKTEVTFKAKLKEAKNDPTIKMISTEWRKGDVAKKLEEDGHEVFSRDQVEYVEKPEPPDPDDIMMEIDDDDDAAEIEKQNKEAMAEATKEYEEALAEYNEAIAEGKFIKGLIVEGNDAGREVMLSLSKKSATAGKTKEEKEKLTEAEITAEVERIKERQKRFNELDFEKVTKAIKEAMGEDNEVIASPRELSKLERGALLYQMAGHGYSIDEAWGKNVKIKLSKNDAENIIAFSKLDDKTAGLIMRNWLYDEVTQNNYLIRESDHESQVIRIIANDAGIDIKAIKAEQDAKAEKRQANAKVRIDKLKKLLKEKPTKAKKKNGKK